MTPEQPASPIDLDLLTRAVHEGAEEIKRLLAKQAETASTSPPTPEPVWQRWRAEEGRWTPMDHLPPGYAADPPPWDPLPGEVLQTPAFPLEDFGAIQP